MYYIIIRNILHKKVMFNRKKQFLLANTYVFFIHNQYNKALKKIQYNFFYSYRNNINKIYSYNFIII